MCRLNNFINEIPSIHTSVKGRLQSSWKTLLFLFFKYYADKHQMDNLKFQLKKLGKSYVNTKYTQGKPDKEQKSTQ